MPVIPPSVRVACLSAALPRVGGLSPGHRPPALPSCSLEPWIFSLLYTPRGRTAPYRAFRLFPPCHPRFQTRRCFPRRRPRVAPVQAFLPHTSHVTCAVTHTLLALPSVPFAPLPSVCHTVSLFLLSCLCAPFQASLFFSALTSLSCLQAVRSFLILNWHLYFIFRHLAVLGKLLYNPFYS